VGTTHKPSCPSRVPPTDEAGRLARRRRREQRWLPCLGVIVLVGNSYYRLLQVESTAVGNVIDARLLRTAAPRR